MFQKKQKIDSNLEDSETIIRNKNFWLKVMITICATELLFAMLAIIISLLIIKEWLEKNYDTEFVILSIVFHQLITVFCLVKWWKAQNKFEELENRTVR